MMFVFLNLFPMSKRAVCSFVVQHISNNAFSEFLNVVEFWLSLLYFMKFFIAKKKKIVKNG